MTRVVLAPGVEADFGRILDHHIARESAHGPVRIEGIVSALDLLASSPLVGRPVRAGLRELVIGRGASGYVALYRYIGESDLVVVLAIRGQREAGYDDH